MSSLTVGVQALCVGYVVLAHAVTLALMLRAVPTLRRGRGFIREAALPPIHPAFEPPVSVLVVARDEAATIVERVAPLLALDYPEFEVVVVNDGSTDGTLAALEAAFALEVFPEAHWRRLPARPVRAIFPSGTNANLRVVDKEPGGDADALNSAVNASRFPLVCVAEPDATLRADALHRLAAPFLEDPVTVAACSPALSSAQDERYDEKVRALRELLADIGRATTGPVLAAPRGVVAFRKDAVVEARGYRSEAAHIVVDLIARAQRAVRERGGPAHVAFVAEPICRAGAEEGSGRGLRQRAQQQALVEALHRHGGHLARNPLEMLAFGLDGYRPVLVVLAYAAMAGLWFGGAISGAALLAFVAMGVSLGILVSAVALLIEAAYLERLAPESSFGPLVAVAVFEWVGFRQRAWGWRARGLLRAFRSKGG